jgi:hypothetical protein
MEDWAQRVKDGFVPLVRELAGFRGYYLLEGGLDVIIAISMFDSADEALLQREGRRLGGEKRHDTRARDAGGHGGRCPGR